MAKTHYKQRPGIPPAVRKFMSNNGKTAAARMTAEARRERARKAALAGAAKKRAMGRGVA